MRRRVLAWAGAVMVACLIVEGPWLVRQVRVDACIDRGGHWDATRRACEEDPDRAAKLACADRGGAWNYDAGRCGPGTAP